MSKIFTISEGLENLGAMRTGGQGSVYKAKRIGPIISAVKIIPTPIHSENADDRNYRTFQNEVQKLKKVNEIPNPNVVKIMNSGLTESGSFPFIEMEYIEGPDLEELLAPPHNPVFTIRETIKLAEQLANALAHCHRVGVKHGDIKSNNVKFNTATGNYILLDFGLAIMSDEQRRSSVRHAGAVEFMAPEQHDGEMFFQTDIYSYGIVLYELLAGTVPFPLINKGENSRNSVMLAHIDREVPNLLSLRKSRMPESWSDDTKAREMQVPDWLLHLIGKCLEKRPENRYANGMELQEELTKYNAINPQNKLIRPVAVPEIPKAPLSEESAGDTIKITKPIFYIMVLALVTLTLFAAYSVYLSGVHDRQVAMYRQSLDSAFRTQPLPEMQEPAPDTALAIQPIIPDTAVLQAETDIDSLQKEYEKQMAKPVPETTLPSANTNKPSAEPVLESQGKRYRLPKSALYFYDSPSAEAAKRGVLGLWSNTKFNVTEERNGFVYVTHTNDSGEITKGWLKLSDLKEVP